LALFELLSSTMPIGLVRCHRIAKSSRFND
jgi:hypothetical protein